MSEVDTNSAKGRRNKRWPEALKREIVAAAFEPSASVSVVARQYDVNANQVFSWRRRYLSPTASSGPASTVAGLLPVTITPEPVVASSAQPPEAPAASETIEIEVVGGIRVRVGSGFDGRTLERVLDVLDRARCARGRGR